MKQDLNEIDMFYIEEVNHNHVYKPYSGSYKPYSGSYKPKTASKGWLKLILGLVVLVGIVALIDKIFYAYVGSIIG